MLNSNDPLYCNNPYVYNTQPSNYNNLTQVQQPSCLVVARTEMKISIPNSRWESNPKHETMNMKGGCYLWFLFRKLAPEYNNPQTITLQAMKDYQDIYRFLAKNFEFVLNHNHWSPSSTFSLRSHFGVDQVILQGRGSVCGFFFDMQLRKQLKT